MRTFSNEISAWSVPEQHINAQWNWFKQRSILNFFYFATTLESGTIGTARIMGVSRKFPDEK